MKGLADKKPINSLPEQVCFRVTRSCNARCGFCLAPPDGAQPDFQTLTQRIDWLIAHGVSIFQVCGGEPTVHRELPQLIEYIHARGGKTRLTTNAIKVSDALITVLKTTGAEVKVSLHGDEVQHNRMTGVRSFAHTEKNLRRLIAARVPVSIQTTVVAGAEWVVDWMANYCQEQGLRRLSLMPFLPRGSGDDCKDEFGLSPQQRRRLRDHVKRLRHRYNGRVDIRWLDFNASPIHVVDADGSLVLEGASDAMDELLGHIQTKDDE